MIEIQLPGGSRVRAALFGLLSAVALVHSPQSAAAETNFNGQLDYSAFKRAAERRETVRITYSPGGTGAAALALARNKVIIDGQCNSACAWSFVKNENACFTPRAVFGFHAAHDPGTGHRMNAATSYWLSTVRGSLRGRLAPLLETSSLITVPASQMRNYYGDRACGASQPKADVAASTAQHAKPKETRAQIADREPKNGAEAKARKVDRSLGSPGSTSTWEALAATVARFETQTASSDRFDTVATFVTTHTPALSFDAAGAAEMAAGAVQAVTMLSVPEIPEDASYRSTPAIIELASALASKQNSEIIAREWLIVAGRDDDEDSAGRIVVGGSRHASEAGDRLEAALPIVEAARAVLATVLAENKSVLAQLAEPGLGPDDCDANAVPAEPIVQLHEVSVGPCDLPEAQQRADLGHKRAG